MYIRTVSRTNKSGSRTSYLQLASNQWDPILKRSVVTVIANLGRVDQGGPAQVANLAEACGRFLGTVEQDRAVLPEVSMSRPAGGAWVLDGIWRELGIDQIIASWHKPSGKKMDRTERILFAMAAGRALSAPGLDNTQWTRSDAAIPGMPHDVTEEECGEAIAWLTAVSHTFVHRVYATVSAHVNPDTDLVFFDSRSDSLCGAVGMAVTKQGIPVWVWTWPAGTGTSTMIRQVRSELRDSAYVVRVTGWGCPGAEEIRGGDGHILGEKLRSESARSVPSQPGRYRTVAGNWLAKEVTAQPNRHIICLNPRQAIEDEHVRTRLVARLDEMIAGSDTMSSAKRAVLRDEVSAIPRLNQYLRVTPTGLLRVNKDEIAQESGLDGKYLLRTSDTRLTLDDIVCGYKQLRDVESGWRDIVSALEPDPAYLAGERIRAHVILCWLALLLVRIIEIRTGQTWAAIRLEMQRLHEITYAAEGETLRAYTATTPTQQDILDKLGLAGPI